MIVFMDRSREPHQVHVFWKDKLIRKWDPATLRDAQLKYQYNSVNNSYRKYLELETLGYLNRLHVSSLSVKIWHISFK